MTRRSPPSGTGQPFSPVSLTDPHQNQHSLHLEYLDFMMTPWHWSAFCIIGQLWLESGGFPSQTDGNAKLCRFLWLIWNPNNVFRNRWVAGDLKRWRSYYFKCFHPSSCRAKELVLILAMLEYWISGTRALLVLVSSNVIVLLLVLVLGDKYSGTGTSTGLSTDIRWYIWDIRMETIIPVK